MESEKEITKHTKDDKKSMERLKKYMKFKYLQISMYVIFTVLMIYLLILVLQNMGNILYTGKMVLEWSDIILKPLAVGFIIAYLMYPFVNFVEKKIDGVKKELHKTKLFKNRQQKKSRNLAVLISCLIVGGMIFLILSVLVSTIAKEVTTISFKDIDAFAVKMQNTANEFAQNLNKALASINVQSVELNDVLESAGDYVMKIANSFGDNLVGYVKSVTGFLTNLIFAIIFAIYFMADGEELKKYWGRVIKAINTPKNYARFKVFIKDVNTVFSGYIRGQLIDAFFMAVTVSITLTVLHIKYALLIGIFTGLGNMIPYVGSFVAYTSTSVVCVMEGDFKKLAITLLILFIIQTIDGNVVNPRLLGSNIDIHPVLVIIALLVGGALSGFTGMILAVPCSAILKKYFEKFVDNKIKKKYNE